MATIQTTPEIADHVNKAIEAFNQFAAIDGDADVADFPRLRRLQIEHCRWQARMFATDADRSVGVMLHGITEEACWELTEAVEANAMDEVMDSLGDILIYTCAVCTDLRLDFQTLSNDFAPDHLETPGEGLAGLLNLYKAVGMLSHVIGKHRQKTRGYDDMSKVRIDAGNAIVKLCKAVHWLAFNSDWDASIVFEDTLTRVMRRDWKTNKVTGGQLQFDVSDEDTTTI